MSDEEQMNRVVQKESKDEEDKNVAELLDLAEGIRHDMDEKESVHSQVKEDLLNSITQDKDKFTKEEFSQIEEHMKDENYQKVREIYYDAMKRADLKFGDDELDQIAETFKQDFEELVENTEKIKNSLMELKRSNLGRDDAIDLLYGSSSLNKKTIERVFDAIDELDSIDESVEELGKIVRSQDTNLRKKETEKVLEKMKEKFGDDES